MLKEIMNIYELEEKLGVSAITILRWELQFGVPCEISENNEKCYSPEAVKIFKKIKASKPENSTDTSLKNNNLTLPNSKFARQNHFSKNNYFGNNEVYKTLINDLQTKINSLISEKMEILEKSSSQTRELKTKIAELEEEIITIKSKSIKAVQSRDKAIQKLNMEIEDDKEKIAIRDQIIRNLETDMDDVIREKSENKSFSAFEIIQKYIKKQTK